MYCSDKVVICAQTPSTLVPGRLAVVEDMPIFIGHFYVCLCSLVQGPTEGRVMKFMENAWILV